MREALNPAIAGFVAGMGTAAVARDDELDRLERVEALVLSHPVLAERLLADAARLRSVALKVKRRLVAPFRARLEPVRVRWSGGFHAAERAGGRCWRWAGREGHAAALELILDGSAPLEGTLRFSALLAGPGRATLSVRSPGGERRLRLRSEQGAEVRLRLAPGSNRVVLSCEDAPVKAVDDSRALVFALADLAFESREGVVDLTASRGVPAAEQALHAAGFWVVETRSASACLRVSRGMYASRVEMLSSEARDAHWLFADRVGE